MSKNLVYVTNLGALDTATISAGVLSAITLPLPGPASIIRIINRSNIDVAIAYGPDNTYKIQDLCPAMKEIQIDLQTNSRISNYVNLLPAGYVIWGTAAAAGVGFIYATVYYQTN